MRLACSPSLALLRAGLAVRLYRIPSFAFIINFGDIFSWYFTARKPLRAFNSRATAAIGLLAGFSYAVLGSTQRLLGIEPNESEVKKYGALTPSQAEKLVSKLEKPLISLIDSNYDQVEEEEKKL